MENLRKKEVRKILLSFKNLKITFNEAYDALNLMVQKLEKEPQIIYRDISSVPTEKSNDSDYGGLMSGRFKDDEGYTEPTTRRKKKEEDEDDDYGGGLLSRREY